MIRFLEEFGSDSLANINRPGRWETYVNNGQLTLSTNGGPFSEGAFIWNVQNALTANTYLYKTVIGDGTQITTSYVSMWFRYTILNINGNLGICTTLDNGTAQVTLILDSSGRFSIRSGSNTGSLLGAVSNIFIPLNQWGWLSWKTVYGTGTSGSIEVRWNNTAVIGPTSSLNTAPSGNARANQILLGHLTGTGTTNVSAIYNVSDFMLFDQQGSVNNAIPTASRVYFFLPTGAGTFTQYTPLTGSNWQRVSQNPDTGDSSYNSSATPGNKDTFAHAAVASNLSTVAGVQTQCVARIDDAGPHTGQNVLYDGTTEVDAPTSAPSLSPTYGWIESIQETNLTSGLAFSPTDITNLQFGYKLTT